MKRLLGLILTLTLVPLVQSPLTMATTDEAGIYIDEDGNHRRGKHGCNFSKAKKYYEQDSKDLGNQTLYATCLVIKGEDAEGMARLYHLADFQDQISASFFLAEYLETDGGFSSSATDKTIDEAIRYYSRTLALIALNPDYPYEDYFFHERNYQSELNSVFAPAELYLWKYRRGAQGDYVKHLLQSPSYEGSYKNTYPKYNIWMQDSLNKSFQWADRCANWPPKWYHRPNLYEAVTEVCNLIKDTVRSIIPLEEKRQGILLQAHCNKDLNKANCPEYWETHIEIEDHIKNYIDLATNIFQKNS